MLRRRPDDTYELLVVEQALWAARPAGLSAARRAALRSRIMSSLGRQEAREDRLLSLPTERWVAVPVGLGLVAAAILVAKNIGWFDDAGEDRPVYAQHPLNAPEWPSSGDVALDESSWGLLGSSAAYAAEGTSTFEYQNTGSEVRIAALRGTVTLFAQTPVTVEGGAWRATLGADAVARFAVSDGEAWITAIEGLVSVSAADGSTVTLALDKPYRAAGQGAVPADGAPSAAPAQSPAALTSEHGHGGEVAEPVLIDEAAAGPPPASPGPSASVPPAASHVQPPASHAQPPAGNNPAIVPAAAQPAVAPQDEFVIPGAGSSGPEQGAQLPQDPPPPASGGAGEGGSPAASGQPAAGPEEPPGQGSSNANGNGNANGQDNGNANGQGNANGEGNGNANGEDNGNGTGPGNGNANGQGDGDGHGNGNANGEGNGNVNGEDNGNGNGPGNGNANGHAKKAKGAS